MEKLLFRYRELSILNEKSLWQKVEVIEIRKTNSNVYLFMYNVY